MLIIVYRSTLILFLPHLPIIHGPKLRVFYPKLGDTTTPACFSGHLRWPKYDYRHANASELLVTLPNISSIIMRLERLKIIGEKLGYVQIRRRFIAL